MFARAKAIEVFLWGGRVGVLSYGSDGNIRFEYDRSFLSRGIEIAPFEMPLSPRIYSFADFDLPRRAFGGLPGVFADSLPDSFGNKLVAEWMRRQNINLADVTPLDRLAYIGSRGMGALTYEPDYGLGPHAPTALDMRKLVEEARMALNNDLSKLPGEDALREIIRVGTSAGGAQAKAIVAWNRETGVFLAGQDNLPAGFEHWIIKFTSRDTPHFGEEEHAVYRKALAAGVTMSECRVHELDGIGHFMTRRFDRQGNSRHLLQTYCAMRHLPAGAPGELCTYEGLFDTVVCLGMDYAAREQMFRRMAFNVYIGEHDDHTKNFSFLMKENGKWELAPAYDLTAFHASAADDTFSEWMNRHALSVNGRFSSIRNADMLSVGERFGIGNAVQILQEVKEVAVSLNNGLG